MLEALRPYLESLPAGSVSVVSVNEKALGVGNWRGIETLGSFAIVGLKGGHLEAVVRFQFQADQPNAVDDAVNTLQARLLAGRDALWKVGLLHITAQDTTPAEFSAPLNAWRKTVAYKILYEFRYQDTDGAESLIARIPIHSDPEERDSPQRETITVTDEMVRWDNEAAPTLVVRGRWDARGLSALAFIPGTAPTRSVTLRRTFDQATGHLCFADGFSERAWTSGWLCESGGLGWQWNTRRLRIAGAGVSDCYSVARRG